MSIKEFTIFGYGSHFKNKVIPALNKFKNIKIKNIVSENKNIINSNIIKKLSKINSTEHVYISTPIAIHESNLKESIKTKHVKIIICEKSITNNHSKLLKIINKCKQNKILLLESFMYKYHPQFLKIKKMILNIHNPNINEIIFCRYTIPKINRNNHRKNNKLTGGEIYEIGCYPISLLYFLFNIDILKLKKIKNFKNIKKNNKQLVYFEINNLKFILSWGYNSVYRNKLIFKSNHHTIIGNKIFGKRLEDDIKINYTKNKTYKEYKFKSADNFLFMFKYFFSLENNNKNRVLMYKQIIKVSELINFFKI